MSHPVAGQPITFEQGKLHVPTHPIVPFVEGDGTGPDIWRASRRVFDVAVEKAYRGSRRVAWHEVLAGEKAFNATGNWLPDETVADFRQYLVGIKGPLTTPVGGGIRSLNVALRQMLDLYVCLRPVRYFQGVPSPVKCPEKIDMVIFRENTEDIYAGIEFQEGTPDAARFAKLMEEAFPQRFGKVRFPKTSGFGIKPVSRDGTERLVRAAIEYAIALGRKSVTLVHKGNIMKFTEGAFRDWGYALAKSEFGGVEIDKGPWQRIEVVSPRNDAGNLATAGELATTGAEAGTERGEFVREIVVKDIIADNFLQQILTRPDEYDVIATLNLNGDYISDALAAQVGGIGIAPGGNINYQTGHAIFEATHGTAPKYAGLDKVNPGSVILSGEMMFRHLGWPEAADLIVQGVERAIQAKTVTYDFARLMEGAKEVKCSQFAAEIVKHMG